MFFVNFDTCNNRIERKRLLFPGKMMMRVAGIYIIWKLMEYFNDPKREAPTIPTFCYSFLQLRLEKYFTEKITIKMIITKFFSKKNICPR